VGKVLGWADEQLPEDSVLGKALASRGVGSGGQGYSTRRYFEIVFLIEFAIHWKLLPQEIRASAASDPWAFLEVVKKIDGADSRQMRHCSRTLFSPINSSASPAEITSSE
jgi:5-methylcytosine-specific restriction protein B